MNQRDLVFKVEGQGVDGDVGIVLVYRQGDRISLVATAEENGDAEVVLDRATAAALGEALTKIS